MQHALATCKMLKQHHHAHGHAHAHIDVNTQSSFAYDLCNHAAQCLHVQEFLKPSFVFVSEDCARSKHHYFKVGFYDHEWVDSEYLECYQRRHAQNANLNFLFVFFYLGLLTVWFNKTHLSFTLCWVCKNVFWASL